MDPPEALDVAAAAELIDRYRSGLGGQGGILGGDPLVLVDLDSGREGVEIRVPVSFPAVVVGFSRTPLPGHLGDSGPDVALAEVGAPVGPGRGPGPGRGSNPGAGPDPGPHSIVDVDVPTPWVGTPDAGSELTTLRDRIMANPVAATTLVQVLRAGRGISVPAGLIIESLAYSTLQGGPEFGAWLAGRTPRSVALEAGDPVLVDRQESRLVVTLNRPSVHNAYNAAMRDGLYQALAVAAADPTITGVDLFGAGPSFCSGGDLTEFGTLDDPAHAHVVRTGQSPARLLFDLAERVTAHLHGSCIGSGIELPAFARHVRADPGTRFQLPELAMGLIPGAGGTVSVARRIGFQRTAWLVLSGRFIDASTAEAWGLVDQVVSAGS
jgi:enoyl-CoA hydratase/carnithine racemase